MGSENLDELTRTEETESKQKEVGKLKDEYGAIFRGWLSSDGEKKRNTSNYSDKSNILHHPEPWYDRRISRYYGAKGG